MSKKKSKPVKDAKKSAPKKKAAPKAKASKRVTARPRSQVLPGMEQIRNTKLDRICEGLSEVRADMARCDGEEKDLKRQAIKVMGDQKVGSYHFAGIALSLTPGDVKLSVRVQKEQNDNAPETGSGQDAGATLDEMTTPDDERLVEQDEDAE